jgi:hypothetical protein
MFTIILRISKPIVSYPELRVHEGIAASLFHSTAGPAE